MKVFARRTAGAEHTGEAGRHSPRADAAKPKDISEEKEASLPSDYGTK